jgi:hypothetical protein
MTMTSRSRGAGAAVQATRLIPLAPSGLNLAIVNPEFFLEEERLRMKIKAVKRQQH